MPEALASGPGVSQAGLHSLLDESPFKLGHGDDDLKHQPTRGRAEVEVVPETDERESAGLEFRKGIDQAKRAAEAVQPFCAILNSVPSTGPCMIQSSKPANPS